MSMQHSVILPCTRQPLIILFALACCLSPAGLARGADDVVFDMDSVRHKPTDVTTKDKKKLPVGTAELVEGKFGKAVKFTFIADHRGGFFTGAVKPTPAWNDTDGFSFWVKGDGSSTFGGIELIDKSDFGLRYGYCFPIDSTEWRKVTVAWRDLVPELAGPLVDAKSGYAPANFGNFWFGKFYYWRDFSAHSFTIDYVALEKNIEQPPLPPTPAGLSRVRTKLKEKRPITIVTMGDSLSDKNHWANRKVLWSALLAEGLKAKYGSNVRIINPAIGGTTLSQNVVLIPRWVKEAPSPDLVTILFGGNDWDNKVRGERFRDYLRLAVDQVRRQTNGSADILLMSTGPAHARWEVYKELEEAARDVAAEKKTGFADFAGEFRKAGSSPDEALKREYWVWDKVHLGSKGHELARDVVMAAIGEE